MFTGDALPFQMKNIKPSLVGEELSLTLLESTLLPWMNKLRISLSGLTIDIKVFTIDI
jgi:hypothetical protein